MTQTNKDYLIHLCVDRQATLLLLHESILFHYKSGNITKIEEELITLNLAILELNAAPDS